MNVDAAGFPAKLRLSCRKNRSLKSYVLGCLLISGSTRRKNYYAADPVERRRFRHGLPLRKAQIDTAQGHDPRTDRLGKIVGRHPYANNVRRYLTRLLSNERQRSTARMCRRRFTSSSWFRMVMLDMFYP